MTRYIACCQPSTQHTPTRRREILMRHSQDKRSAEQVPLVITKRARGTVADAGPRASMITLVTVLVNWKQTEK